MAESDIKISDEVVAVLAREAALSVDGIAEMSSSLVEGIGELLGKKSSKKGIKVDINEKNVSLDLYLTVNYGCNIPEVAKTVQVKVKEEIESMTDFTVCDVNVNVVNLKYDSSSSSGCKCNCKEENGKMSVKEDCEIPAIEDCIQDHDQLEE